HNGGAFRRRLLRAEQTGCSIGRFFGSTFKIERRRSAPDAEPKTGLRLVTVISQRGHADVTAVFAAPTPDSRGGRHGRFTGGISVIRFVDPQTRVDCEGAPLEFECKFDFAFGGELVQ